MTRALIVAALALVGIGAVVAVLAVREAEAFFDLVAGDEDE